ncbi:hypothetical protein IAU59_003812 [Kwoniella sp. CBS 9459]
MDQQIRRPIDRQPVVQGSMNSRNLIRQPTDPRTSHDVSVFSFSEPAAGRARSGFGSGWRWCCFSTFSTGSGFGSRSGSRSDAVRDDPRGGGHGAASAGGRQNHQPPQPHAHQKTPVITGALSVQPGQAQTGKAPARAPKTTTQTTLGRVEPQIQMQTIASKKAAPYGISLESLGKHTQ